MAGARSFNTLAEIGLLDPPESSLILTAIVAAASSSLGIVIAFNGATRDFYENKRTVNPATRVCDAEV